MMDSVPAKIKPVGISCPSTGAAFKVRLSNDTDWLAEHWQEQMKVTCPSCGKGHSYRVKDIYLSEAIADDKTIPNLFAA